GRVVLLDFGLAAELDRSGLHQSTEYHVLGTIAYMSPEQGASAPVTPASDWYSIGIMLYEALTVRLPFVGTPLRVLRDKQELDPPAPATLVHDAPEDLNLLCVELLRRDPTVRPSGQEVLRRLGGSRVVPGSPALVRSPQGQGLPLVGRENDLAMLTSAWQAARNGRTVIMHVQGSSGVGKSALVQAFLEGLRERREAVVLTGRCYECESGPFKALDSLVDALSRHLLRLPALEADVLLPRDVLSLARVFPVLLQVEAVAKAPQRVVRDPQALRRRAFVALRELLARLGDRHPLVLCIDDLQWGDVDSAVMLVELLRSTDQPILLLLACYRNEDANTSPCLRILRQPHAQSESVERRELTLGPLSAAAGRELVLRLLDSQDDDAPALAESIACEANGNPFLVQELAQFLRAKRAAGDRRTDSSGEDATLDGVLWARVLALPEEARRLLEVMALAGRPLAQEDACRAADVKEERAALTCLRTSRLLRSTGSPQRQQVEICHDRIRETVIAHLDPMTRRRHHAQLARVLESA